MGTSIVLLSACAIIMVIALILVAQLKRKDTMSKLLRDVLPKNYYRHHIKK